MGLHRNSQKRLYIQHGIYFITINTYQKHPYFNNDILCELFLETLDFTGLIKGFNLHGFAINPEHLHLMIEPTGKYNCSEIMGTLKRNFARDCNDLLAGRSFLRNNGKRDGGEEVDGSTGRAITPKFLDIRGNQHFTVHLERLSELHARYVANDNHDGLTPFQWQRSFRAHLIKDKKDYQNHLSYIMMQPENHHLPGRKWYWVVEEAQSSDE